LLGVLVGRTREIVGCPCCRLLEIPVFHRKVSRDVGDRG
jgi:hypothetical protein